jgi:hypothetical protein
MPTKAQIKAAALAASTSAAASTEGTEGALEVKHSGPTGRELLAAFTAAKGAETDAEKNLADAKIARRNAEHLFASKVGKGNSWEIDGAPCTVVERLDRLYFRPLTAAAPNASILDS